MGAESMLSTRKILGALACSLMVGVAPLWAQPGASASQKGPAELARLLAEEAKAPSSQLELRIAQFYGPSPASIGSGGMRHGSIGPDGVPVDYRLSMEWLRRAAQRCHD